MLLRSRITQPAYPTGVIPRPRLYARLATWRDARAVVIHAPSGYGKSTLISQWIDGTALRGQTAWLSLDADDRDPHEFVSHFAAALESIVPGATATVDAVLADPRGDPTRALSKLLVALEEEFAPVKESDPHILVVLDDLQRASSAEIDPLLQLILEHGPRRLHLVLLSRHRTSLPLARLYAQQALIVLGIEDLRFTVQEVHEYLHAQGYATSDATAVEQLTQRSEGWIAALQLCVLSSPARRDVAALVAGLQGGDDWLTGYVVDEVLNQQPAHVRSFLLQTSILDEFNAALCTALTGQADATETLADIARSNLFLIPLGRRASWFRYHHLFQDLLQSHLSEQTDQATIATLHRRAAAWLAEAGMPEASTRHLLAAGDVDAAAEFVETQALAVMPRDPFSAQRLLDLLNDTAAAESLEMLLTRCLVSFMFDSADLPRLVQQVDILFEAQPHLRASAPAQWAQYLFHRAEVEYKEAKIDRALETLEEAYAHAHLLNDFVLGSLHFLQMRLLNLKGLDAIASEFGEKALSAYTRAGFSGGIVALQRERTKWAMDIGASQEVNRQFRSLLVEQTFSGPLVIRELALACLAAAENSYWQNDDVTALSYQRRMLTFAQQLDDEYLIHLARFLEHVYTKPEHGTQVGWPQAQTEAINIPVNHPLRFKVVELAIRYLIVTDQKKLAWHFAHETGLLGQDIQPHHRDQILVPYCLATIARGGDLPALTPLLRDALAVRVQSGRRFGQIHVQSLTAWQQLRLGNRTTASAHLEQARQLACETGYVGIIPRIPQLALLLQELEDDAISLTEQEVRVLTRLSTDRTYSQIARDLHVSVNTVRTHVRNLYRKLGVSRRAQAVDTALERGLLPPA